MTTNINTVAPETRANLLEEGLVAVITGSRIDEKYFDRLNDIWPDDRSELILEVDGAQTRINKESISYRFGSAIGNLSGIMPYVELEDPKTQQYRQAELRVDDANNPYFRVYPEVGSTAVKYSI